MLGITKAYALGNQLAYISDFAQYSTIQYVDNQIAAVNETISELSGTIIGAEGANVIITTTTYTIDTSSLQFTPKYIIIRAGSYVNLDLGVKVRLFGNASAWDEWVINNGESIPISVDSTIYPGGSISASVTKTAQYQYRYSTTSTTYTTFTASITGTYYVNYNEDAKTITVTSSYSASSGNPDNNPSDSKCSVSSVSLNMSIFG